MHHVQEVAGLETLQAKWQIVALLVGVMTTYYFSYSDFESGFGYLFGVPGMSRPCQTIAL